MVLDITDCAGWVDFPHSDGQLHSESASREKSEVEENGSPSLQKCAVLPVKSNDSGLRTTDGVASDQ